MLNGLQALVPIFTWFILGTILRSVGVATREHAQFIFRLVFFVTLPALAFDAISQSDLGVHSLALPLAGFLVNLGCAAMAAAYCRITKLEPKLAGAVVLAASITNMVFMFPFFLALLGPNALVQAVLYDIGNAVFVATGAYVVSSRYGTGSAAEVSGSMLRMLSSPLFVAVIGGIAVSISGGQVPELLRSALHPLGTTTMPLILIALGVSFSIAQLRDSIVYSAVGARMVGGLLIAIVLVYALGLEGTNALIVVASASAPIGFNAATLASIGKLDVEHATASLSVSVAIGLVTAPTMMLLGARWM